MGITFDIAEAPRVYVERIDINGNTLTQDKVIRREFRLTEGDAFNSIQVKRTTDRIKSLGYFQEDLEVEQKPGSAPDRIMLKPMSRKSRPGSCRCRLVSRRSKISFSRARSSSATSAARARQLRAVGFLFAAIRRSRKSALPNPICSTQSIALSGDIFRRDLNSFNFLNNDRNTTYQQATTGFQIRAGVPLTEFLFFQARYSLNYDDISLDPSLVLMPIPMARPVPANCDPPGRLSCAMRSASG